MIVSANDMKTYLPTVNIKAGSTRLNEHIAVAQADIVERIIGTDIEATLELPLADGQPDTHALLRTFVSRAICMSAFLDAIPELDLQMSEAGFVVASNDAVSPASKERVATLRDSMKKRKTVAFDAIVSYLVSHSSTDGSIYADWRGTAQFAHLSQAMVFTLATFRLRGVGLRNYQQIDISWDEFYNIIPRMKNVMETMVAKYVSAEYLQELLEKVCDAEALPTIESKALYYIQCAIVAGTVEDMKLADSMARSARDLMVNNISSFPTFKNSSVYSLPAMEIGSNDAVANML